MNNVEQANFSIGHGKKFPYDAPDDWYVDENSKPPAHIDWAHMAANGIIADLTDRRGIKNGFDDLDHDVHVEIVRSISEIIRIAAIGEKMP